MTNRRQYACIAVFLSVSALGAWCHGQGAKPAALPAAAYTNADANAAVIEGFIKAQVALLCDDKDAVGQATARTQLVAAAKPPAGGSLPGAFYLVYAGSLNKQFMAKLNSKPSTRVRVNMAIVTTQVAELAENQRLTETVLRLLEDKSEAVVLWGMRAAKFIVRAEIGIGANLPKIVAAIRPAVDRHPAGLVVEEAYNALGERDEAIVVSEVLKLWSDRLKIYETSLPENPSAEGRPAAVLFSAKKWKSAFGTKEAQRAVMQLLHDQMVLAAKYADAGSEKEQLQAVLWQCISSSMALGDIAQANALAGAAMIPYGSLRPPKKFVGKFSEEVSGTCAAIREAFPGVKKL